MSVSDSRKEMVGQLLKDVVEAVDRPQLNTSSESYDRFGFRLSEAASDESAEDKVIKQ